MEAIYNSNDGKKFEGSEGNDRIELIDCDNCYIDLGDGDDSIYNVIDGYNCTIYGGNGNDYIYNDESNDCYIDLGDGDDSMTSWDGDKLTIYGGKGNDYINISGDGANNTYIYNIGDGDDTLEGLGKNDTIKIASGEYWFEKDGNDLIFLFDDGSILVKDFDYNIKIETEDWFYSPYDLLITVPRKPADGERVSIYGGTV